MKKLSATIAAIFALCLCANAADFNATEGAWSLDMPEATKVLTIQHNGKNIFNSAYATVTYNYVGETTDRTISSLNSPTMPEITTESIDDEFGSGKVYTLRYTDTTGAVMRQRFAFYPELPHMIVQVDITGANEREVQSRSLTALAINEMSTPLTGSANHVVWVPFDNDGHVKYGIKYLINKTETASHEVGYIFDGESRLGLVAGSVDHDKWKSAVIMSGSAGYKLEKFTCLSGFTNSYTRDVLPHGKVKGTTVASSRFFVGLYDDWRQGLNEFAEANTKVVPRIKWTGGNPMGWNSWGVLQDKISYESVVDCAMFIKEMLYDLGFHDNNGQTVISLDSFADYNISIGNLYKLGTKIFCDGTYKDGFTTKEGTNQVLGQYYGPLVLWEWNFETKIEGTGLNGAPDYKGLDIGLKVNGKPYKMPSNAGYAVDPTHPGVRAYIEFIMKQYANNGTKYIKVDFLNNGIVEGDSWYDPNVTTGVMAYNYGMKILREEADKYGIYIAESIAPIFPYQYAEGRRTCCDRWSRIEETEYVMNSITYGWWTDKLYPVNDPDHLVMCRHNYGAKETLGENRARATSGMTAGAFLFGDNFSDKVSMGYPEEARVRALQIMGNPDINEYVRNNTGSFMPVNGHHPSSGQSAETILMRRTSDAVYVAVFNYSSSVSTGFVTFDRLGIGEDEEIAEIKELWMGQIITPTADQIDYVVPAKDSRVYRIEFNNTNGITETVADHNKALNIATVGFNKYLLTASTAIANYSIFDVYGRFVANASCNDRTASIDLSGSASGMYIISVNFTNGTSQSVKIINR